VPDREAELRREAVRRVLSGESAVAVAAALGRSQRWVFKWHARYAPGEPGWAAGQSRAARRVANKTAPEIEALVLEVRAQLAADPWSQVGAVAIAWELHKLGVGEVPELRTIERLLARHGVARRPRRERYRPKGTPYPHPPALAPNACQEADLVGPRHLAGALSFYVLNVVDLGRHTVGSEIIASKADAELRRGLLAIWRRLGLPARLKLDNQPWLAGGGRYLSGFLRMCLALGVTPVFIPFREPWRNPVVEHFNDTFNRQFFRAERFSDVAQLAARSRAFEAFHNAHHRYTALGGLTPDEAERRSGFVPRLVPDPEPTPLSALSGQVEFIRLIRSDRRLRILTAEIELPASVVHEYVTAVLDVGAQQLTVEHRGRLVCRLPFPLPS
jgi:putative transposase